MLELIYRTEDISPEDLERLFVETTLDRTIIDAVKAPSPVIVVGSRGVGKSFLLRMAENELNQSFSKDRVLPIYVSFNRSSLIHSRDQKQFFHWMLSIICGKIIRTLRRQGFLASVSRSVSIIAGGELMTDGENNVEKIMEAFESSWQSPDGEIDTSALPSVDDFKDAIEEICQQFNIKRFNLLIDEAAHIFRPEQQRQFFTLFRDLRMARLSCNAAVYPGVTFYGDSFQPVHDATFLYLDRDLFHEDYLSNMREIVGNQIESTSDLLKSISKNVNNFNILAYAASGNPRILLKTVARCDKMSSAQINEVFREFYKSEIWSEHSQLGERYIGHRSIIDWGRKFIETDVLPEIKTKNDRYLEGDKKTTCFFWVHRDSPQAVKEALRLLTYTGLVSESAQGIKGTRSEIGTRYQVNLGILFSIESNPASTALSIARNFDIRRMTEYGMNYTLFNEIINDTLNFSEIDSTTVLYTQLHKDISFLDLAKWQIEALRKIPLNTIGDILKATEAKLREMYYVGEKRARRIKSAALTSVLEYLSG
jgi:hypothetical protein